MSLTTVLSLWFFGYITFLLIKFKEPLSSISESWYALKKLGPLFTLWCFGLAIILAMYSEVLLFLAGASLGFVGAAAMFKDKMIDVIHYVGATFSILFGFLYICLYANLWSLLVVFIFFVSMMLLKGTKNIIWWAELLAFALIVSGLYLI